MPPDQSWVALLRRARVVRADDARACGVIVVLSDDQLQEIEDALESACDALTEWEGGDPLLVGELTKALYMVQATRRLMEA